MEDERGVSFFLIADGRGRGSIGIIYKNKETLNRDDKEDVLPECRPVASEEYCLTRHTSPVPCVC